MGAVIASVAVVGMTPSEEVQAQRIQANIVSACGLVPALYDALSYTVKTWPFTQERVTKVGPDTFSNLLYFGTAIEANNVYYKLLASSSAGAAVAQN